MTGEHLHHPHTKLIVILLIAFALLVGIGAYIFLNGSFSGRPVACTLEGKLCPDGSVVGRVGPNCEFAACSGE